MHDKTKSDLKKMAKELEPGRSGSYVLPGGYTIQVYNSQLLVFMGDLCFPPFGSIAIWEDSDNEGKYVAVFGNPDQKEDALYLALLFIRSAARLHAIKYLKVPFSYAVANWFPRTRKAALNQFAKGELPAGCVFLRNELELYCEESPHPIMALRYSPSGKLKGGNLYINEAKK
ncbi:MAG: hypothetical protein SVK08_00050 [Halobacteriota archaeon]|nr:hypothetical protein [Halobacteriota archaeon]